MYNSIEFWEIEHYKETIGNNNPYLKKLIENEIEEKIILQYKNDKKSNICLWTVQSTDNWTQTDDKQDDSRSKQYGSGSFYSCHPYTGQEEEPTENQ